MPGRLENKGFAYRLLQLIIFSVVQNQTAAGIDVRCCTEKTRQEILIKYICGDTPKELSEEFGIRAATVYRWINTWENETGKHFLTELPLQKMGTILEYVKIGLQASPYDNAPMESFFGSLKTEEVHRYRYHGMSDLAVSLREYSEFYNHWRPHVASITKLKLKQKKYITKNKAQSAFLPTAFLLHTKNNVCPILKCE